MAYTHLNYSYNIYKAKILEIQGEINTHMVVEEKFNTPFSEIN